MRKPKTSINQKAERDLTYARTRLVMAALAFVDCTLAESDALDGSESSSLPAEFMILHDAARQYREANRFAEKVKEHV